ncbi:unnamed protein product [Arctogadus glacialis]
MVYLSVIYFGCDAFDLIVSSQSDTEKKQKTKGALTPTKLATLLLYDKELEVVFGPFDDWVTSFDLYRGKANDSDGSNDQRFVGKFKDFII